MANQLVRFSFMNNGFEWYWTKMFHPKEIGFSKELDISIEDYLFQKMNRVRIGYDKSLWIGRDSKGCNALPQEEIKIKLI